MDITIETTVKAPIEKVWAAWTEPEHVTRWNFAMEEWCCPRAESDLTEGGTFNYRMEARDGSMGFDFEGTFTEIEPQQRIAYVLADDRKVTITLAESPNGVTVTETFEAEDELSGEQQRQGWQSILGNFKKYVESNEI